MLQASDVEGLRAQLRGDVIEPGDPGYDGARAVYNAMIDRKPRLVVRARDTADVLAALRLAREHDLNLAVRGGGHHGAGLSTCDDGVVIDLGAMRSVRVDPSHRTATVGGGALLSDLDHATHAFGLAVPGGTVASTGVGGLTLGGGIGYLTRRYGLTIDNLLGADVVLADGTQVRADEHEHRDLLWALKGGGGNFGIVTSFTFRAHPVHTVYGGPMFFHLKDAESVMKWYRTFIEDASDDIYGFMAYLNVPPVPVFPEALHNETVAAIIWCHTGDLAQAEKDFEPIRKTLPAAMDGVQPMPFPALQSMFDPLLPAGLQWYWRTEYLHGIPDDLIPVELQWAGDRIPDGLSTTHIYPINGAAGRVDPKATAWFHRDATFSQVVVGIDPDAANAGRITQWTKDFSEALHPFGTGGAYVNFMTDTSEDRVRDAYGDNYDRLARIKGRYDPDNVFRMNANIRPAPTTTRGATAPPPA